MESTNSLKMTHTGYPVLSLLTWLPSICFATAAREVETRPDGTTITREATTYYPPQTEVISHSIVIGIVVVFGGLVALFGIKLILKALELGHHDEMADVVIDLSAKNIRVKKLAQGAVVTTIGAAIMLGALYFLTFR